jgi:hypothetical protein
MNDDRARFNDEMARTTFQRKVVSRDAPAAVLDEAIRYFSERGYRSGRSGRPNQSYVIGGREGGLPRVTAEILVQPGVGKSRTTLVTISGFGEDLARHLSEFATHLRARSKAGPTATPDA